ncbi:Bardet-Biedl syndrome 4 protein homolog isoform X2 [Paramacrobiotus metropolitanus]|uniref:Bardet-Biedl syndrome 4 protein homolog isoform X2 n=1 Tax=Paramacrobiotus metropolitanus TaxID=2943436 RepID=UPI0024463A26|nr:Bardet-Biedl syndrome 4 protein homolog isoform X2 [Paramacrobiotus metropolitanus]
MSRGAVLENTPSAGKLSIAGQNVLDPERSSIVQRGIYQRVQESDGRNWLFYQLFLRQDFDACSISLATCEEPNSPVQGTYGVFMKGLIAKRQGKLTEALNFMKSCHNRDQRNLEVLRELISLCYLTCNYKQALQYVQFVKAMNSSDDWFLAHHQGLCYERLGDQNMAEEHLKSAINIYPQEKSYLVLVDYYLRHDAPDKALELLERAKRVFPESSLVSSRLGFLQIKNPKELDKGFGNLAQAAAASKLRGDATLLAVASVMQRKLDPDGALKKYEVILQDPGDINAAVLNNIGLCYFAKRKAAPGGKRADTKAPPEDDIYAQRILQAIGCLEKARQLAPFDARIAGNLGYVARELGLFATASYNLMSAIRLTRKTAVTNFYMLLAGVAENLEIQTQANQLYRHCVKSNSSKDPLVFLNFASFLLRQGEHSSAAEMAQRCHLALREAEKTGIMTDPVIVNGFKLLRAKVSIPDTPPPTPDVPHGEGAADAVVTGAGSHEMVVAAQVEPNSPK